MSSFEAEAVAEARGMSQRFDRQVQQAVKIQELTALLAQSQRTLLSTQEALDKAREDVRVNEETLERIAYVLRTFYYAQISLSTIQPVIALALELNPELVEQRR
jgi:hypothetical protein